MLLVAALACRTAVVPEPVAEAPPPVVEPTESAPPAEVPSLTGAFDPTAFTPEPMTAVPLLGGTLEPVPALDGAVAADPDGDRVMWLPTGGEPREVALGDGARPFRIEVDGGTAWVTLRGTGEVARIELGTQAVSWRVPVCAEPRGIDHAPDGTLVVACAGGALVGLDDASGAVVRSALLPSDLRDVVGTDGILYVSRFRPGEVLLVDPLSFELFDVAPLGIAGRVAWRMRPLLSEGVIVLYDEVSTAPISGPTTPAPGTTPEYYVADTTCQSLHQPTFATVDLSGTAVTQAKIDQVVLPVDFAIGSDQSVIVINGGAGPTSLVRGVAEVGTLSDVFTDDCLSGFTSRDVGGGQPSSVAERDGTWWVATQGAARVWRSAGVAPATLAWDSGGTDALPDEPFALFHQDAGTGIACASCHPDGQDDANLWEFANAMPGVAEGGTRRTMTLAGSLASRAPFHWMGELADAEALVHSTFTLGMGGREISAEVADDLVAWLDGVRPVRRDSAALPEALAAGEALFAAQGCETCHAGEAYTANTLAVVRPGSSEFKTPSLLGLGMRSAFLHDGCAPTLEHRFVGPASCTGGDDHGLISSLSPEDIGALVAWLETR